MKRKRCKRCYKIKPLSEFSKHHETEDGLTKFCKACSPRRGPKSDVKMQARLGFPGRSKKQIAQILSGGHVDYSPDKFEDLQVDLVLGSLMGSNSNPLPYDGHFKNRKEAFQFWLENGEKWASENVWPALNCGTRGNFYWEMMFGIGRFLDQKNGECFWIEKYNLWVDGERAAELWNRDAVSLIFPPGAERVVWIPKMKGMFSTNEEGAEYWYQHRKDIWKRNASLDTAGSISIPIY